MIDIEDESPAHIASSFLFVASERTSLIFVYDAADPLNPIFKQALPAAMAPEGVLAIPSRKLLVVASQMRG
ncbi:MAG: hypothetical protein NVV73_19495 [Cellvibrionaceae bacterium]|nr:hypothetical protein [Cellvibrionaceae bacterium]